MIELKDLLCDDEVIATYGTSAEYYSRHCIVRSGSTDIAGALEETLHRILENDGTEEDVYAIMGASIPSEEEREALEEFDEYINIDLGYCIPGLIMSFTAEGESL